MKKIIIALVLCALVFSAAGAFAEEKNCVEAGDVMMVPIEVTTNAILLPVKAFIGMACELNNYLYPKQKINYKDATGDEGLFSFPSTEKFM